METNNSDHYNDLDILKEKIIQTNNYLRSAYSINQNKKCLPFRPLGGNINESIGPWPEYILHGYSCYRSKRGYCTPCGYSNITPVVAEDREVQSSVLNQVDWILSDFDLNVLSKQCLKNSEGGCNIVITPIGSFFSNYEINPNTRKKILQKLKVFSEKKKINFNLYIESHSHDVISSFESGELNELNDYLTKLNTTIIMGFESRDNFVRNVLYCKNLDLGDFEKAYKILNDANLRVGAFLFAGCHSMLQGEILEDVEESIIYLNKLNILPVFMIANFKEYTIDHLLFKFKKHVSIEPRTILDLITLISKYYIGSDKKIPWLLADPVGGPPDPEVHPFNSMKYACAQCSQSILEALRYLRQTYDWGGYFAKISKLNNCECVYEYERFINHERAKNKKSLLERAVENVQFAHEIKDNYITAMKRGGDDN